MVYMGIFLKIADVVWPRAWMVKDGVSLEPE
jgi:hypothetical protein